MFKEPQRGGGYRTPRRENPMRLTRVAVGATQTLVAFSIEAAEDVEGAAPATRPPDPLAQETPSGYVTF